MAKLHDAGVKDPVLLPNFDVTIESSIRDAAKEVERKFDEIVAFAETEKFLDTAVKHYSSGMYVRLGFAVAVHMKPDVLLVDEEGSRKASGPAEALALEPGQRNWQPRSREMTPVSRCLPRCI